MFVVLLVGGVIAYVFRHQVKSDIVSFLYRAFYKTKYFPIQNMFNIISILHLGRKYNAAGDVIHNK